MAILEQDLGISVQIVPLQVVHEATQAKKRCRDQQPVGAHGKRIRCSTLAVPLGQHGAQQGARGRARRDGKQHLVHAEFEIKD